MKLIKRFCQRINLGPVISYREKLSRYAPAICAHAIGVIDGVPFGAVTYGRNTHYSPVIFMAARVAR